MPTDPVYRAKERVPNRFLLSVLTFERAKQLIRGARPRTDRRFSNAVTTAVQEIGEGHVTATEGDETGQRWSLT